MCANVYAQDAEALVDHALGKTNGDYEAAALLLAQDLVLFTGEIELLERDTAIQANTISILMQRNDVEKPSFIEKLGNSTVFKVGLFALGVYVGREMVKVK